MMKIRTATPDDSEALLKLLGQLGYDANLMLVGRKIKFFATPCYHLLVCDVDSRPVGFLSMHWFDMFHTEGKLGRITAVCIDEKIRHQGYGRELLKAAEKILMNNGCTAVEVTTNFRRSRTPAFYLKNGYTEHSKHFVKKLSSHG